MKFRNNLELKYGKPVGETCGSGGYTPVRLVGKNSGLAVWQGVTCICGRGCCGRDCVRDDWGDHDTDIEQWRAD